MIDGFSGTPTVADFGNGKYKRRVIFDTTNPCTYYYVSGGTVKSCGAKVTAKNGVPVASDFSGGADFIFNTSSPCDLYYLDGGTVKQCNPTVIAYTGKPPASAFSGGAEFIRDRSNPCDVYYLDGGTVKQCSSGGTAEYIGLSLFEGNMKAGDTCTPASGKRFIVSGGGDVLITDVSGAGSGTLEIWHNTTFVSSHGDGSTVTLKDGMQILIRDVDLTMQ